MSEELKSCPFCGGEAMPVTDQCTTRCHKMTTCVGGLNEVPVQMWNTRPADKAELDEGKIERLLRCGIFYKEECAGVTGTKITLLGFENTAKLICARFRPAEKMELDEEEIYHCLKQCQQELLHTDRLKPNEIRQENIHFYAKDICARFRPVNADKLVELVDGAIPIIESWVPESPAQREWKKRWVDEARQALAEYDTPGKEQK